jgi:diadenosine tetraphosphatase ApaH/serine/threonine PP2A family protein phosphatase
LREERRLKVFENWVYRRIFGPKKDELRGEWRKLHNEELNDLFSSPDIVRVIKSKRVCWAVHVDRMMEISGRYRVLVGKPNGQRPLGRPSRMWEVNI